MENDNQIVSEILNNLGYSEKTNKMADEITAEIGDGAYIKAILKGSREEGLFFQRADLRQKASRYFENAQKIKGFEYLEILCEKESGDNLNPKFLKQLIATFADKNKISIKEVNAMLVVDFVKKLKKPKNILRKVIYLIEKHPVISTTIISFIGACLLWGFNAVCKFLK